MGYRCYPENSARTLLYYKNKKFPIEFRLQSSPFTWVAASKVHHDKTTKSMHSERVMSDGNGRRPFRC